MKKLLLAILLILSGQLGPEHSHAQDGPAKGFVENMLESILNVEGRSLSVENASISLTGDLNIARVEVRDSTDTWLVIENLALVWRPLSLFGKQLQVDGLTAKSVHVLRMPQSPEGSVAAPKEFQSLAAALIRRLSIETLTIDRPVFGQDARLALEGSAEIVANPPKIRFDMTASRLDGKKGDLATRIVLDPVRRNFNADVTFAEEADGIVAAALSLRGGPSVALGLSAAGNFTNWKGTFNLDLDKQRTIEGNASSAADPSGQVITVNGTGAMSRLLPQSLEQPFTGISTLSASMLVLPEGGAAQIEHVSLDNSAFGFRLAGVADWAGTRTNLAAELTSKDPSVAFDLPETGFLGRTSVTGLSAALHLSGLLTAPAWKADLNWRSAASDRATFDQMKASLEGQGVLPSQQPVTFKGDLKTALAQGRSGNLPPALIGPVTANVEGTWRDGDQVDLTHAMLAVADIAFETSGTLKPLAGVFDLAVSADTGSLKTGYGFADQLLAGPVAVKGRMTGGYQLQLALQDFTFASAGVSARSSGTITADAADLSFAVTIPNLATIRTDMNGTARFDLQVKGPWQALEATLDGSANDVRLRGKTLENPKLDARLRFAGSAPNGDFGFSANLAGKPVNLGAKLESDAAGMTILRDLIATAGSVKMSGELRLPTGANPTGTLTFDAPDLRDVGPLFLSNIAGRLSGDVVLTDNTGVSEMKINFSGRDIVEASIAVGRAEGNLTIISPFGKPRPSGTVTLVSPRFGAQIFDSIAVAAETSSTDTFAVTALVKGRDLSADVAAEVTFTDSGVTCSLSRLSGTARNVAFKAAGPVQVRQQGGAVSVEEAVLNIGAGRVRIGGKLLPQLDAKLRISALPLSAFEKLAGAPGLHGNLAGEVSLSGRPDRPDGQFKLSISGLTLMAVHELGLTSPLTATANGSLNNGMMTLAAKASSGKNLSVTADGKIDFGRAGGLDIMLKGRASGKVFAERFARSGLRVEGIADLNLRLAGPLSKPGFNGTITLSNGIIGDTAGRFTVQGATGRIEIKDRVLRIVSLIGTTGSKGHASATGTVALDGDMNADLRAKIENGIYSDGSFVTSRYDADLALKGPLTGAPAVTGNIGLRDTKITLSEMPRRALAPLDVKHKSAPRPVVRQAAELRHQQRGGSSNLTVDVQLKALETISVSGRGLNVALNGGLRVFGPIGNLAASGSFRLIRGTLALPARSLDVERGSLTFDRNFDPLIDFVAVSRRSNATITLRVRGRMSDPEILVTSSPQLPEEEAMARLIFDSSIVELSPIQVAQIASYVATLSGGGSGLMSGLQSALGVDYLTITETKSGETQIGTAKRINDRLSVGVEQTTKSNTTRVIIDLNATKNLKLRGAVGSDQSSRAGIFYEKDY